MTHDTTNPHMAAACLPALQGSYSWEADLWSIGVITYILLSGFPPFWGSSDYMIFQRILENDVVSHGVVMD